MPFLFTLAAAAVVVALDTVVAAAAEQQDQDDDPPAVVPTKAIVTTHNEYLPEFFERWYAHSMVFRWVKKVRAFQRSITYKLDPKSNWVRCFLS